MSDEPNPGCIGPACGCLVLGGAAAFIVFLVFAAAGAGWSLFN